MPYQKRIPPVKVELSIEKFNLLVEMLTRYTQMSDERVAQLATKMKDKLLRYSIPRTEEGQDTKVDIRFYPNEASEIIYMLIYNVDDLDISANYFEVLQKVREAKKQEMNNE